MIIVKTIRHETGFVERIVARVESELEASFICGAVNKYNSDINFSCSYTPPLYRYEKNDYKPKAASWEVEVKPESKMDN